MKRKEFDKARRRNTKRAGRNEVKRRISLKLASYNVKSFKEIAMRAVNVESFIAHEELDVLFACETLQRRWKSGIIPPLKFEGSTISMPDHKP